MNKRVTLNIISYFGRSEIRENRKRFHQQQLIWASNNFKKEDIYIASQAYNVDEYNHDIVGNYVDCLFTHCSNSTGPARNVLLKRFYESDEDYAIFVDNDSILDERNMGSLQELLRLDISSFGLITPVYPAQLGTGAFTKSFETGIYKGFNLKNNFVFERCLARGNFMIIKNFKKHHNTEIWFDDGTKTPGSGGEDNIFGVDIVTKLNLKVMLCRNLVIKELATGKNSASWSFSNSSNPHRDMESKYKENMQTLFSEYGIYVKTVNGKKQLSKKDFFKKYDFTGKMFALPKENYRENKIDNYFDVN